VELISVIKDSLEASLILVVKEEEKLKERGSSSSDNT